MPQFFIDRPIFAWVVALAITLAGLLAIPNMPVSQYPDVAPPSVTINATYPGASAQDVADSVASVIENELNGAKGLLYYESVSDSYGQAEITATFQPGTDPDMAQVDVQNRISNVTSRLPAAVMQQGLKVEQSNPGFLLLVTMSSSDGSMDQTAIADYIARNVQNEIARVPGVGKFQLFASPRAMRVWVDPDKLTGFQISMAEVMSAIANQNTLVSAGILGSPPNPSDQQVSAPIVVNGELRTVEEFENIVLRANTDGSSVRVGDIARVAVGSDNYQFGARLNGKPTAAFAISLTPDANALSTAEGVKTKMAELSQYFPPGIEYAVPYDTTPYVNTSIKQVIHTLVEAMFLVFVVMFIFLQNVRYTLIPALVVPIAILGAMTVMLALGYSINVLTMFAMVLAIGILVDDAIVVVENVERIMVEDGSSPREATSKAMPQISGAVVGMTLVLATVFFPLAFMSGSVGIIYRQFAVAMAVSILFSGFLALTFTPALCATILKPIPKGHHEVKRGFFGWFNRKFDGLTHSYEGWVGKSLKRTGRLMLVYLVLVIAMGFLYFRLPTSFLPQEDQGYTIVNIELPAGATANRTIDVIEQVENYFFDQPQVKDVITVQGFSFNGSGLNAAIAFTPLKDFSERKGVENSAQAIADRANAHLLFGIPDAMAFSIVPPAISSLGNAAGFDMRLQDRGGVGQVALQQATQQLLGMAMQNPMLSGVRVTGLGPGPQLDVTIDREKAAALGVDFSDVAAVLSAGVGSSYVSKFPNMGRIENVWVQAEDSQRMGPEDIMKMTARNQAGEAVPLSSFVKADWSFGPVQVVRYNSYQAIRIGGTAAPGYSTGEAMTEMENMVGQLPAGFGYEWTGLSYQEKQAGAQTLVLMGLAMLVVFMVLAALYESWAIPLSVMLMVPLGMLGAVGLVTALGMENNVYFQVGMVTVIGLAAKNAILIVEFAKDVYAETGNLVTATIEAARLRFRPILMTSFAFILGVVPLTLASGAGAAGQNAVGFGVLGGMLAATPLAMLFVPTFFVFVMTLFKAKVKANPHHTSLTSVHHDDAADETPPTSGSDKQGDQA
ncbi:multidrug efflux RND transporter permease subunit [Pusillimonas sp. CC-YST705]|uniref:Efflux pump membrane transporter n=1 Tax=Mesopusillimonas faecipullorum TaxID=2755040 RepID=A0ABS8CAV2_9BURK|nr:efflux RND transporter permease subunit [Mesopusillimonas faecipullorum]MCB5363160.1 multidrug efflux RND transporter permease subunit [Mesopusillimonas faecipullorum]